jgi:hypothetical protein
MKRMRMLVVVALALAICLPGMALADTTLSAALGYGWEMPKSGDPSLAPYAGGVPSPFTITSFEVYFSDTVTFSSTVDSSGNAAIIAYGGTSFVDNNWTGNYVSGNYATASGDAISSGLKWDFNFLSTPIRPITFDINYFNAGTFVGHEHYTFPIGGTYAGGFDMTRVPLPPSVLLMGTGLLGLVGLAWRRRKES